MFEIHTISQLFLTNVLKNCLKNNSSLSFHQDSHEYYRISNYK